MASDVYQEFAWRRMVYEGTEGVADLLAREQGDLLHRFRSDRVEPACRIAAADAGAGADAAIRTHADCDRGRRDGPDWRPERPRRGRWLLSPDADRGEPPGHPRAAGPCPRFRRPANPARIVNNADWLTTLDLMSFLRDIGKHFTGELHAREGVGEEPARAQGPERRGFRRTGGAAAPRRTVAD